MSYEKETIEDIVKEMRGNAEHNHALVEVSKYLTEIADRIEAAANRQFREVAKMIPHEEVDVSKMETTTPTCEKSSADGNAAAMRKALSDACYAMFNFLKTQNGVYEEMAKALDKAKAALAAPPRNCDRFATLDDARNAFFADYVPDETCSSDTAFAIWIFDEVKGETDGSK